RRLTAPNSFTWRGRRVVVIAAAVAPATLPLIEAQSPADQRDGKAGVAQHRIVELAQREAGAARRAILLPQLQQLAPPHRVAQRVRGLGAVAPHLGLRVRP